MIVLWRVSNHCNLACPFCAYDKRLRNVRQSADPMEVARVIRLLGDWRRQSGRAVLLSWLGGEPLLWRPREELDRLAVRDGLDLSLTTNGTQLGSLRVREQLVHNYREVTVSIDGYADFHDRMRGWPGAFEKLAKSVAALAQERTRAQAPLKLRANVVLMRDNIDEFAKLCRTLASWGVDEISFNQLGGRDRPEFYPEHRLRAEDIRLLAAILPALRAELAVSGATVVGNSAYLARIADTIAGTALPVSGCRVADQFLFVDEAGRIAPCSFAPEHFGVSIKDLHRPEDFEALPNRFCSYQSAHPAADCADCPSTQQFAKFEPLAA